MNTKLGTIATRSLLAAGLALGITAVHARDYNVTRGQEQQVQVGMSAGDVRMALGTPTDSRQTGNEPGPTWSYAVVNATPAVSGGSTMFEIGFGTSGRVISAQEFVEFHDSMGD